MTADKNLDFTLTEEMAILFVRDNELDLDDLDEKGRYYRVINLEGFNNMTDGAAKVLSEFDGQLNLQNLSNLPDSAAEHLSNYQGESLCLDSLVELSDAAADGSVSMLIPILQTLIGLNHQRKWVSDHNYTSSFS